MSPNNTKYCYIKLPNEHTPEYIEKSIQIKIIDPLHIVKEVPTGNIKSEYALIFPKRHNPPTSPTRDLNISPVQGY